VSSGEIAARRGGPGKSCRAAAPAPEQTPFPAKLWRVWPMRLPARAARVVKGSWLVDSIWRTKGLGAATLSIMDCLGRAAIAAPIGHVYSTAFEGLDKRRIVTPRGPIREPAKYELVINLKTDLRRPLSGAGLRA
jgi:hypothetical protein